MNFTALMVVMEFDDIVGKVALQFFDSVDKKLEIKINSAFAPLMNFFTFFYLIGFIIAAFIL